MNKYNRKDTTQFKFIFDVLIWNFRALNVYKYQSQLLL